MLGELIIFLLICGFAYWVWTVIRPRLTFIAEPFLGLIDLVVLIVIGAVVVFKVLVPLARLIFRYLGV